MEMGKIIKKIALSKPLTKIASTFYEYLERAYWENKYNYYRQKYRIHPTLRFNGVGIVFYGDGDIICGPNSYIGSYSSVQAYPGCKVVIGKNCAISHYVMIYTANRLANQDFSKEDIQIRTGDVIIEDYCWVGARVFIREGIKIGRNSVIGANSVVTRDIPPNSIAVGNPAKVVKYKNI